MSGLECIISEDMSIKFLWVKNLAEGEETVIRWWLLFLYAMLGSNVILFKNLF